MDTAVEDTADDEKSRRGRDRERNLKKGKGPKRRSCSEDGHIKLGNGLKGFCTYCRPTLSNRLARKVFVNQTFCDPIEREDL
jgi:hypothetical protein